MEKDLPERRKGKEGLKSKPHLGRKPKLSPPQRRRLVKLLLKGPRAHGFSTELWTLSRVTKVIRRRFGVTYHSSYTWRVLSSVNWSCQKPERRARERDKEAIAAWREREWPRLKKRPARG